MRSKKNRGRGRKRRKKEEEEKVADEEGGGAKRVRQAGRRSPFVRRKISQPGRGPMPVNSVGRSLTR